MNFEKNYCDINMGKIQLLGHEREKKILQRAQEENRISHSYCFIGIEGTGKDALALEFAKTVNCKSPVSDGGRLKPCNVCKSCTMADHFEHPNIQFLFALPTGKKSDGDPLEGLSDQQIDEIKEQLKLKAEDPYYQIEISGANTIKINSVREIKRKLSLTAGNEGRRFIIISQADKMTEESQNAFLKTLEEPHENITLILTTSRKDGLLQTILSRCQQIKFDPIPDELITDYLADYQGIDKTEAAIIAQFAQGSITRAKEFLDSDVKQLRDEVVEVLRSSMKGMYRIEVMNFIEKLTSDKNKNRIKLFLNLLLVWIRDAHYLLMTKDDSMIINRDQINTINKFSDYFNKANYHKAMNEVELTIRKIDMNVAPNLLLITLFISLREIFLEKNI